jgi:hypothetical protein
MLIRRYGDLPAMFVPDEGEVVLASRSIAGPFLRAVVIRVRRRKSGAVRIDFEWMDDYDGPTPWGGRVARGAKGNVYVSADDAVPLIRRLPKSGGQ